MSKYFFKQLIPVAGILLINATLTFGQITDNPTNRNIVIEGKTLYERGFNKDHHGSADTPHAREARDSVTVTSTMTYFVMPDRFYNREYFDPATGVASYGATNRTRSAFEWTMSATGFHTAIAPRNPNATTTSPLVDITWANQRGQVNIQIKERPQIQIPCDGEQATIPIQVIRKPEVKFLNPGDNGGYDYEHIVCVAGDPADPFNIEVKYPIQVITESHQVYILYTLRHFDLDGALVTEQKDILLRITEDNVASTTDGVRTIAGSLTVTYNAFGSWEIEIQEITDRIARKSNVLGIVEDNDGSAKSTYTVTVLPRPQPGRTFHVPNNF